MKKRTDPSYAELKAELDEIVTWFESQGDVDIDRAVEQYEKAQKLIRDLEEYLQDITTKISKKEMK